MPRSNSESCRVGWRSERAGTGRRLLIVMRWNRAAVREAEAATNA